jgi:hypothetical protein
LHTILCVNPRRRIGQSQIVYSARAVNTLFICGFSVRHRNVQAAQVRRRLDPPPPQFTGVITRTACFGGLIKTCTLPTASALMGLVPIWKLTQIIFVNNIVLQTRCVISVL